MYFLRVILKKLIHLYENPFLTHFSNYHFKLIPPSEFCLFLFINIAFPGKPLFLVQANCIQVNPLRL